MRGWHGALVWTQRHNPVLQNTYAVRLLKLGQRVVKRHWIIATVGTLLFAGCASPQIAADASTRVLLSCNSSRAGSSNPSISEAWSACLDKAQNLCGSAEYTVLTRSDEPGFQEAAKSYEARSNTKAEMIVQCRSSEAPS